MFKPLTSWAVLFFGSGHGLQLPKLWLAAAYISHLKQNAKPSDTASCQSALPHSQTHRRNSKQDDEV